MQQREPTKGEFNGVFGIKVVGDLYQALLSAGVPVSVAHGVVTELHHCLYSLKFELRVTQMVVILDLLVTLSGIWMG